MIGAELLPAGHVRWQGDCVSRSRITSVWASPNDIAHAEAKTDSCDVPKDQPLLQFGAPVAVLEAMLVGNVTKARRECPTIA